MRFSFGATAPCRYGHAELLTPAQDAGGIQAWLAVETNLAIANQFACLEPVAVKEATEHGGQRPAAVSAGNGKRLIRHKVYGGKQGPYGKRQATKVFYG